MNVELFDKFLTDDEKKEIVGHQYELYIKKLLDDDVSLVVSNAAYHTTKRLVNEQLGGKLDELIVQKVKDCINDLSEFTVLRYDRDVNRRPGFEVMAKAIQANAHLLNDKVIETIKELDTFDLLRTIEQNGISFEIKGGAS